MQEQPTNFAQMALNALDEQLKKRGVANILIAGKTGVGKSTLVNSVFQGRLATTGQGKPVTQKTTKYTKEGIPVAIFDTKGLEVKDYNSILEELIKFVTTANKSTNDQEHIHVAWICIAEGSRRVEDAEILLAEKLSHMMPVVIVITTANSDQGFRSSVKEQFPFARNVVRVNSVELALDGREPFGVHGLEDLVNLTMEVIPEGQKNAFAAAQKVTLDVKLNRAHMVVAASATTAAGFGAAPIPFSDVLAIVPVQITMLAGISLAFGLSTDKAFIGSIVSGTFTAVAGSFGGRAAVGALLKFFPGIGSVAGGAISAAVAAAVTTTFGEAYIATLYSLLKQDPGKQLTGSEVAEAFRARLES